jgi:hypothetical protein
VTGEVGKFVTGYVCPTCETVAVGLPLGPNITRPRAGWTYRTADGPDLKILCASCNVDVPREHWTFSP